MGPDEQTRDTFAQEDHQVAYIFDQDDDETRRERPSKRRRVSKQAKKISAAPEEAESLFVPLLSGKESAECVRLRQRLYEDSWAKVDARLQGMLRESNLATLEQVTAFVAAAGSECDDQIPAAFIITGPNIASQDLLFEQLSETLQQASVSRFVRLRSAEAATLKAALKKTIRDATASAGADEDESLQVETGQDGRKYLDYDLEALEASIRSQACEHVYVAFQDSESFDSGLLSDLITLFHSWRPRIPFTLLFGIATSVELLQARLLKSACRLVYGAQFDCVQTEAILETLFRGAVAACDVPLRLGAPLLRAMLDRQHDQIAGVQAFISSLKYAYMCHFYANPLCISTSPDALQGRALHLQAEHVHALRNLPSFRRHVEQAVELGDEDSLRHAKSLIEDDDYLLARLRDSDNDRQRWVARLLRALLVREAAGAQRGVFSRAYLNAMADGVDISEDSGVVDCIRRMTVDELSSLLQRVSSLLAEGDPRLNLSPSSDNDDDGELAKLQIALKDQAAALDGLRETAQSQGFTLRSKYSGQSKVMRTTVIAQRVQLSQDSATLRDEDKRLTEIVDDVARLLTAHFGATGPAGVVFSECWVYDSRSPARDVFVPRPRAVFERSLGRPHDYLGCSCCAPAGEGEGGGGGIQATLPATSILYQLYLETGSLINVADLWAAFDALVSRAGPGTGAGAGGAGDAAADDGGGGDEPGAERERLVMFYRGLAELRALGYVKASKKKPDHVAKVKWL
ncbi:Carbamoyl-phosphate synthase arginine-specific large chain [Purpureocillium lavendulum]|uniref:Carbamoyl-phosphate synthase arginine-specific large chain n=1 Tax=Purpureocillium lavendulum TaxID=1247861 RepID=A0AB34G259_9HYPO|nr:Carbamoyl-phosphate synthase arginine-specific large chain [Purpureocillium lavendulum]